MLGIMFKIIAIIAFETTYLTSKIDKTIKDNKPTDIELITIEKVQFVNGEPIFLEGTYIWKTKSDFDRFMRFANSYAKSNGLGYSEKK